MGIGLSKNNKTEIKCQKYAKIYINIFLELNDISHIKKINKVLDFSSLLEDYYNKYKNDDYLFCHNFYSNYKKLKMTNINDDSEVAVITRNIIYIIRKLMLEQQKVITDDFNKIEIYDKNYKDQNNKIADLNHSLLLETSKINDAKLYDISNISKNIINLREELSFNMNNKIKFEDNFNKKKQLKNKLTNILLFLGCTDHLIENDTLVEELYLSVNDENFINKN